MSEHGSYAARLELMESSGRPADLLAVRESGLLQGDRDQHREGGGTEPVADPATEEGRHLLATLLDPSQLDVSLGGTPVYQFVSADVGTAISIAVTGFTITGADIGNYALTQPAGITVDITPVALRSQATTSWPCSFRRNEIAAPMRPRPTRPMSH